MNQIILAGFGGQGILFAGKLLAYAGMLEDREVSWLPSYGPEMRGGTANCHVIISKQPVASPIIQHPDVLIALNGPSLKKFIDEVEPGGIVFYDSSIIHTTITRSDVKVVPIPATQIATDMGARSLVNMVALGKVIKETEIFTLDELKNAMKKSVSAAKEKLVALNNQAIDAGYHY